MIKTLRRKFAENSFTRFFYFLTLYFAGRITSVDINKCVNPFGFRYGDFGWHPLVAFLKESEQNKDVGILENFYSFYQPKLGDDLNVLEYIHLKYGNIINSQACTTRKKGDEAMLDLHSTGPHSPRFIRKEKKRITDLFYKLKTERYRPFFHFDGFINGFYIENSDKNLFMVLGGQHRCAVLSALGHKKILCLLRPGYPKKLTKKKHIRL